MCAGPSSWLPVYLVAVPTPARSHSQTLRDACLPHLVLLRRQPGRPPPSLDSLAHLGPWPLAHRALIHGRFQRPLPLTFLTPSIPPLAFLSMTFHTDLHVTGGLPPARRLRRGHVLHQRAALARNLVGPAQAHHQVPHLQSSSNLPRPSSPPSHRPFHTLPSEQVAHPHLLCRFGRLRSAGQEDDLGQGLPRRPCLRRSPRRRRKGRRRH